MARRGLAVEPTYFQLAPLRRWEGAYSTAEEYAKWMAFPVDPRAATRMSTKVGRVPGERRGTCSGRELPWLQTRSAHPKSNHHSDQAPVLRQGMVVAVTGTRLTLSHSGGYPGFGSHVLLPPWAGVGAICLRKSPPMREWRPRSGRLRFVCALAVIWRIVAGSSEALATAYHAW